MLEIGSEEPSDTISQMRSSRPTTYVYFFGHRIQRTRVCRQLFPTQQDEEARRRIYISMLLSLSSLNDATIGR